MMEAQQLRHAVYKLINDLDKDQIQTLDMILLQIAQDSEYAHLLSGYIDGVLEAKFQICPACGEPLSSHDPESLLPPIENELETKMKTFISDEMRAQMNEYGLDDAWDIETEQFLYFVCTATEKCPDAGCGMHYSSIEDRMLRPPGVNGCGGCQLRSGHG